MSPGNWLATFHPASDVNPEQTAKAASQLNARSATPTKLRTRAEIMRFFDGVELIEPRHGASAPVAAWLGQTDDVEQLAGYAGVGRKR